jgi:hypothetical protein
VWARVGHAAEQRAVRKLADDLRSGRWAARNREITGLSEIDLGAPAAHHRAVSRSG